MPSQSPSLSPQIFKIVFEDDDIFVIEKCSSFLSQAGDQGRSEGLDQFMARTLKRPIYPVHRLDRDVLGLMIFAKSPAMADALSLLFKERKIKKTYWARVRGCPREREATLVHYLKKNPRNNHVTVYPRETAGAKRAELRYRVISQSDVTSDLEIDLITGRSHQIRAQLAKLGHALIGDTRYGRKDDVKERICLKSIHLSFPHPRSALKMTFSLKKGFEE